MRALLDEAKLMEFLKRLGERSGGPGRVYLTGGGTSILSGWRETTIDVDLKLDPEPPQAFQAIAKLKDELGVNVELASPDDFVPALPGWRDRSRWIGRFGEVEFYHYDFYGQALSKIERGFEKDETDVAKMISSGLVDPGRLKSLFKETEEELARYPAIDPRTLKAKVEALDNEH